MNIERFQNDKDVTEVSETMIATIMTARDFDLTKPNTIAWLIKSLYIQIMLKVTEHKDLMEKQRPETRAIISAIAHNIACKLVPNNTLDPQTENLMLDYFGQNIDKLLDEALIISNQNIPNEQKQVN